jgi:hypothetical protein
MRLITSSSILLAVSAGADAHTLAGDESIPAQLGHQFLGFHHLPLTAILIIGGIFVLRHLSRSGRHE